MLRGVRGPASLYSFERPLIGNQSASVFLTQPQFPAMCSQMPPAPSPGSFWPWVVPTWGPAVIMKGPYVCACVSNHLKNELCCLLEASNRPDIDLWMVILKQPSLLCRRAHDEEEVVVTQWF